MFDGRRADRFSVRPRREFEYWFRLRIRRRQLMTVSGHGQTTDEHECKQSCWSGSPVIGVESHHFLHAPRIRRSLAPLLFVDFVIPEWARPYSCSWCTVHHRGLHASRTSMSSRMFRSLLVVIMFLSWSAGCATPQPTPVGAKPDPEQQQPPPEVERMPPPKPPPTFCPPAMHGSC